MQSTNGDTIREIHRTMRLEEVYRAVNRVKAGKNIHQHLDLIAGLPYEDYDSFGKSFCDVYRLRPQQLQLGFLKVLKRDPLMVSGGTGVRLCMPEPGALRGAVYQMAAI